MVWKRSEKRFRRSCGTKYCSVAVPSRYADSVSVVCSTSSHLMICLSPYRASIFVGKCPRVTSNIKDKGTGSSIRIPTTRIILPDPVTRQCLNMNRALPTWEDVLLPILRGSGFSGSDRSPFSANLRGITFSHTLGYPDICLQTLCLEVSTAIQKITVPRIF